MIPQSIFHNGPAFRTSLGMIRTSEFLGPIDLDPFDNTCHASDFPYVLFLFEMQYHFHHGSSTHHGSRSVSMLCVVVAYLHDIGLVMGKLF